MNSCIFSDNNYSHRINRAVEYDDSTGDEVELTRNRSKNVPVPILYFSNNAATGEN
jgi:hypothetical protein